MHSAAILNLLRILSLIFWTIVADSKSAMKLENLHREENELSYSELLELEDESLEHESHRKGPCPDEEVRRKKRTAVFDDENLWPNATIPYVLADVIEKDPIVYKVIMESIEHWHERTCIKFLKYNNTPLVRDKLETSGRYVEFIRGEGCHSSVGRRSDRGSQNVSIALTCAQPEMIVHELGHLVGLWHEQARYDRDSHVIVQFNNIRESQEHNFNKQRSMRLLAPYDLSSIMHYGLTTFTANDEDVIKPIMEELQFLVGIRGDLSFYDGQTVNALYKCSGHCPENSPKCVNGGYLNKDCRCTCPVRLGGPTCAQVTTNKVCGGVIEVGRTKQIIRSPEYPSNYPALTDCTWLLKSSSDSNVVIYVEDIDLERSDSGTCRDSLEIRYHYIGIERGPRICGNLTHVKRRRYVSTTNRMILRFHSNPAISGKGFRLVANSSPRPNCASNPCKNGAECREIPAAETYFCDCPTGWLGQNCDIEVVDGQWSEWSAWSGCTAECGHEHRARHCKRPVNGGRECDGSTGESRRCGSRGAQCNGHFYCNFGSETAKDDCGMTQEKDADKMDWIPQSGKTQTRNTGPRTGHSSGHGDDVYYYIEASFGRPYDNAIIWLPSDGWSTGRYCLQFHYHMYGEAMGQLRVIRKTRRSSQYLWQESACHGNRWNQANINVILYNGVKIGFEGIRGDSYSSDIALDDISISPGGCSEQMVNDEPSHRPTLPLLPNGKRRRSSGRRRTVQACFHENQQFRVGKFSYSTECQRFTCFCNQNGKVDCPPWKTVDKCPSGKLND